MTTRRKIVRGMKGLLSLFCSDFSKFCAFFFFESYCQWEAGGKKKSTDMLSLSSLTDKVVYGNGKTLIPTLAYSQHVNSSKSLQFSITR